MNFDPQTFMRQRAGGISRLFTDLVREFDARPDLGVEVLLGFRWSNNTLARDELPHRRLRATPPWMPRPLAYAPRWSLGNTWRPQSDILHYTYYSPRFLSKRPRGLQVTTVHDMIPELFTGTEGFTATHLAKKEYVRQSDLVICVSQATRQDMESLYGNIAQEVVVIPNAVRSGFRPQQDPVQKLPSEYLLYVGKREGYKDFNLLPQALQELQSIGLRVPLVLVGPPLTAAELAELDSRKVRDLVQRVALDDSDLARAYANSLMVVQTSRYEGFGLTPLEGMASGVPVVVARASAMPEVGGDVAQYFPPGDAQALAATIATLLESETLRTHLGRQGILRAQDFSTRRLAQRTSHEYHRLMNR